MEPSWPADVQRQWHWLIWPLPEFQSGTQLFANTVISRLDQFVPSEIHWNCLAHRCEMAW